MANIAPRPYTGTANPSQAKCRRLGLPFPYKPARVLGDGRPAQAAGQRARPAAGPRRAPKKRKAAKRARG